jgi:dihydrolipoamide dehydrogenase
VDASATDLILATGSAPRSLPGLDVDQQRVIDSDEALRRDVPPKSVTIVGAGAIGVEWASLYADLGAEVRLVEFMDRIVPLEDPDISKELGRLFRKRGMAVHAASTVDPASLQRTEGGIRHAIVANEGGARSEVESDWIMVAIGRRPVTENIGLEQIDGLRLERGLVVVDDHLRTGVPHLYAIGDIVPGYALAHVASHEAIVAVETIAGLDVQPMRNDLMPRVTFCRPEIASVGLSEAEATAAGHTVKVGSFPFRALGKATIVGEVDGFAKFVADATTGHLLGAHIIGPHAGDLLAEPTFARLVEGTAEEIAMSVHAHPTLTEVLAEAALAVDGAAIHV